MKAFCQKIVNAAWFEPWMIGLIIFNGVLIGTFIVLNLFIAIVINNLEASKLAELEELRVPVTHEEVLRELARTREALARFQRKLEDIHDPGPITRRI